MRAVLEVVLLVLQLATYILIASAILSWLIGFDVVNRRNDLVNTVWSTLNAITEPVLRPIRNLLPNTGGIDLSPVVALLGIFFIERVIQMYIYPNVF